MKTTLKEIKSYGENGKGFRYAIKPSNLQIKISYYLFKQFPQLKFTQTLKSLSVQSPFTKWPPKLGIFWGRKINLFNYVPKMKLIPWMYS